MGDLIQQNLSEAFIDQVKAKYANRFDAVAKVYTGFSDEKALKLGILLENIDEQFSRSRLFEDNQTGNVSAGIKNMYFDIVTAAFPGLIAEELFSVQPLRQKLGQIFYLKYQYGSNKGKTAKGTDMFAPNSIAGYENSNYTAELVESEIIFSQAAEGTEKTFAGNFAYIPLLPGTVSVKMAGVTITDNGSGVLAGTGVSGTINYESGAYSLTYVAAPAADDAEATYEYDLGYAPSTIPQIDLKVVDSVIQARPRKLRGLFSMDAAYDLKMSQGIDMQDSLLEAASAQLRHETDGDLIKDCLAQAALTCTWNDNYNNQTQQLSKRDFYDDFLDTLIQGSSKITQATKRVAGNWIVAGKRTMDILRFIGAPRFVASGVTRAVGPHFAGTLDGLWKVYFDPFLAETDFLIGYKGDTLLDAGLVYAPYLAFFATETTTLDDFVGRRGFATSYGKKMVNSNMYVKGTITHA